MGTEEAPPKELYTVVFMPFTDPAHPVTVAELEDGELAQARAKEVYASRHRSGMVGVVAPEGTWTFEPVSFDVEGLPPVTPGTVPLVQLPRKDLHEPSKPVSQDALTEDFLQFLGLMTLTMYERQGIGIAAPQVGVWSRVLVVDTTWAETGEVNPCLLINPEIEVVEGPPEEANSLEGCLSVPGGYRAPVHRAEEIVVRGKDLAWEDREIVADGLEAYAFQHEVDHLDGKLFIDYLGKMKRDLYFRKLRKAHRIARKQAKRLMGEAQQYERFQKKIEAAKERGRKIREARLGV